jgi:hypothetical protein
MIYYLVTFILMTIIFIFVSVKKKNIFNLLTFIYINQGVLIVFLNCLYLFIHNDFETIREGDFILLLYFWIVFLGAAFIEMKKPVFKTPKMPKYPVNKKIWQYIVVIISAYFIYNYKSLFLALSNPRMFYANSRINGGFLYYIIIPLANFAYFCYITRLRYSPKTFRCDLFKAIIATLVICAFIYVFGQKSSFLIIGFLLLTTIFYKTKNNGVILRLGIVFTLFCVWVFVLYSLQQNINVTGIFESLANYSDYIRNFDDLVDNLNGFYGGRIFLENEIFSYIPRALWPNKPTLFGSLRLGLEVPSLVKWTLSLTGAPSFGPIGAAYADFGMLGVIGKAVFDLFFISIARSFEYKLYIKKYNYWYHILYLTFNGILIFYITLVSIPLYQLAVILLVRNFSKKHRKVKKRILKNEASY